MERLKHSVTLAKEKCIGCTDCMKRCPTEAIRVRNGKAEIIEGRCIDCGMCIRVCRNNAKRAVTDSLESIEKYKLKIAIPAPTLYAQFKSKRDINLYLTAVKLLGFDDVYEVASAAELVTQETRKYIDDNQMELAISSACPAVVRMIQIRFPSLIPNIVPIISPMEATARYVKEEYMKKGFSKEDIGVFFISPCPAKVSITKQLDTISESYVDGVLSMKDVYLKIMPHIKNLTELELLRTSNEIGVNWAKTGGEGKATGIINTLAVDGMENVIKVLERIENGKITSIDFIEGLACVGGCLGGPLTVENSYVAKNRLEKVVRFSNLQNERRVTHVFHNHIKLYYDHPLEIIQVLKLDNNMLEAIRKMEKIEKMYAELPKIDCGSCGAPSCRALAEDIVKGTANEEDCIFMLRDKVRQMAEEMLELSRKLPPSLFK